MEHEPLSPLVSDDELEAGGPTHGSQASAWRRISTAAVLALALSVLALAAAAAVVRSTGSPADSAGLADKVGLHMYVPRNAGSCDCSWIPRDNCEKVDNCANACRRANSWGPCTR
jgi:hypothetical protein